MPRPRREPAGAIRVGILGAGMAGLACAERLRAAGATVHLFDKGNRLGACGDWLIGPRVDAAWLSGDGLAGATLAGRAGSLP